MKTISIILVLAAMSFVGVSRVEAAPPVCGDNVRTGPEDCDGTDDARCPGQCLADCTCPAPSTLEERVAALEAQVADLELSSLVVRDSNGVLVGTLADLRPIGLPTGSFKEFDGHWTIGRQLGDDFVLLPVNADGWFSAGGVLTIGASMDSVLVHESNDCSGPLLINFERFSSSGPSPSFLSVVGFVSPHNVAYYATGPGQQTTANSVFVFKNESACSLKGGTFTAPDFCCIPFTMDRMLAPATTFDLSTLGLVPPFHAEGP